jgi:hypothetical protein
MPATTTERPSSATAIAHESEERKTQTKEQRQRFVPTSDETLTQWAQGWSDSMRAFLPNPFWRPREAIEIYIDFSKEIMSLQRRVLREFVQLSQDTLQLVAEDASLPPAASKRKAA